MQQHDQKLISQQNQIDIIDVPRILWMRRQMIVGGTLLITVLSIVISFFLPKEYEVSTIFEPGKNGADSYVVAPETLKESILGEAYDYRIRKELNISYAEYPKIKVSIPKGTSIIKVSIETDKQDNATNILRLIINYIGEEVNQRLAYEKGNIENLIKSAVIKNRVIKEKIILTKQQIEETNKKIKTLENNKLNAMSTSTEAAMHVLLYSNEIQNQQVYLNGLQEKLKNYEEEEQGADIRIDNLRLQLSRLKGMNILKPVTISEEAVKPKKFLIASLAFITSLFGLIILAFSLNFIGSWKK